MFGYSKIRAYFILAVVFLGIVFSIPNFLSKSTYNQLPDTVKEWFKPITLGLDLQGGSYLLMQVETNELIKEKLVSLSDGIRSTLREQKIRFSGLKIEGDTLSFKVLKSDDVASVKDIVRKQDTAPLNIQSKGNELTVSYTPEAIDQFTRQAVTQSLEIVRRRIDELGTKEPQIQQQGADRIVIQLPGVQDPSEIKTLMGKTAKMSFHLVDEETTAMDAQMGKIAPDSMLLNGDETGYIVVKRAPVVGGEQLDSAKASYGEAGEPVVAFTFKSIGAKKFATATRENVGRRLAIVLDGRVISAPVINSPITGGSGIITGNFSVKSANDLALLLRSGALPAPLEVVEERVVGPGLGEDSIRAGTIACISSLLIVVAFMFYVYRLFGLFANIALLINATLLLSLLSILNATLTLPGLAGIALTLGMAIDANVLVFERMKEEISAGMSNPLNIINSGFQGSFSAILDGQLTTFFAALFLFWLGSGPVRGFGVTLGLGLVTTLFTAVFVTRFIILAWYHIKKPKTIHV